MGDLVLWADASGSGGRDVAGTALQASASALDAIARAKDVQTVLGGVCVLLFVLILFLSWRLLVQARESSAHAVRVEALEERLAGLPDAIVRAIAPKLDASAQQLSELRVDVREALARYLGFTERTVAALERGRGGVS